MNSPPTSPKWRNTLGGLRTRCQHRARLDRVQDTTTSAMRRSQRNIDVHDNLFEIGASSLKLIEIHEQIDRVYPGHVDLTELFDHPTVADLAKHLSAKLGQAA